jgi:hypothetical protein
MLMTLTLCVTVCRSTERLDEVGSMRETGLSDRDRERDRADSNMSGIGTNTGAGAATLTGAAAAVLGASLGQTRGGVSGQGGEYLRGACAGV